MARPLRSLISTLNHQNQNYLPPSCLLLPIHPAFAPTFIIFFLIVAVFSVISFVSFLCTDSHRISGTYKQPRPRKLKEEKKQFGPGPSLHGIMSSKALLMIKMISWRRKVQEQMEGDYDHEQDDDEVAVWRKTILMGERCRPLDFSGKILYDSQGNLLLPSKIISPSPGTKYCGSNTTPDIVS